MEFVVVSVISEEEVLPVTVGKLYGPVVVAVVLGLDVAVELPVELVNVSVPELAVDETGEPVDTVVLLPDVVTVPVPDVVTVPLPDVVTVPVLVTTEDISVPEVVVTDVVTVGKVPVLDRDD